MQRLLLWISMFFLLNPVEAQSPLVYNQSTLFVGDSSLVHVNGDIQNTGPLTFLENRGEVYTRNDANPGHFELSNDATVSGGGNYYVQGDWVNSATFVWDTSHVTLDGDQQLITGDSITTFYQLELDGTGVKTQTIHSNTAEQLILNNRELATDVYTMYVLNADSTAVTNDQTYGNEGMVSSLNGGALNRMMDSTQTYLYPVGSSLGVLRYRPVEITPNVDAAQSYSVRMVNHGGSTDGYDVTNHDSTLCRINSTYYHQIDRTGGADPVDMAIYYDLANDSYYNEMVQWDTPQNAIWNGMMGQDVNSAPYRNVGVNSWNDFSSVPFALAIKTPDAPQLIGDSVLCDSLELADYEAIPNDLSSTYVWSVPGGASIQSGQGTNLITTNWSGSGGGTLNLYLIDSLGCSSFTTSMEVSLGGINAAFDTLWNPLFGQFTFDNQSSGADYYEWEFGDGGTSMDESPVYDYSNVGTYDVVLIAEDLLGCTDTAYLTLEVLPGVSVPNVITPNGDGMNDRFVIHSVGIEEFELFVYNRWGNEVFKSFNPTQIWDGTNIWNGKPLSEGTYFFLYRGHSDSKTYEYSGPVMLLR